jgi:inosose dehydratase
VAAGMYVPLGAGDVDIAGIVKTLEDNGYGGWYVMEQDNILEAEPVGAGPLGDVLASVEFLRGVKSPA